MAVETKGLVVKNRRIKLPYFILEIDCPLIAAKIKPGQFVMLKVSDNGHPLLRRPFSVYKSYSTRPRGEKRRGHLVILYKRVGKGTQRMTGFRKGQTVELIGPLGNGFTLPPLPSSANIILLGGGIGVVSLYPLAEALRSKDLTVFVGARTGNDLLCVEDFKKLGSRILVATEDGSSGFKGTVMDLFSSKRNGFKKNDPYYIYSCGPMKMLQELSETVRSEKIVCQASLEARMACGFGACWGCVVKTKDVKAPYRRVCKDGPVFNLEDILWD